MKHFMLCAAVLCLAASGCARLACRDCAQGGYITRSQRAPRPAISRTASRNDNLGPLGMDTWVKKCGRLGDRLLGKCPDCEQDCTECVDTYCDSCDSGAGYCEGGAGSCGGGESCNGPLRRGLGGRSGCRECRLGKGFCPHSGGYPETPMFNPGPPVGQVAYPYYTVRGPRDFLQDNPPSIGPY